MLEVVRTTIKAPSLATRGNAASVSAAMHGATSKVTPVDNDEIGLADSAASYGLKKLLWANVKATLFASWGALVAAATGKTTPVDADSLAIADSAASSVTKKLTWANVKATLKDYFDTIYQPLDAILTATTASFTTTLLSKLTNIEALADVTDAGNVGSSIHGATAKTTPVDADELSIIDSAASNVLKRLTFANLKVWTKAWLVKADVGLGNVDNTSDATKNAAAVTLTNKQLNAPLLVGAVADTPPTDDDSGLVPNTAWVNGRFSTIAATDAFLDEVRKRTIYEVHSIAGTATAYTGVTSSQRAEWGAGAAVLWQPHLDCGAAPRLAVAGLFNEGLYSGDDTPLKPGEIRAGVYQLSLLNSSGHLTNVPLGTARDLARLAARFDARPGEAPLSFTADTTGLFGATEPLDAGLVATAIDARGKVVTIAGEGIVGHREPVMIGDGDIWRIGYEVRRRENPLDPSSDAVVLKVQYLNRLGAALGSPVTLVSLLDLSTSSGKVSGVVVLSRNAGDGIDFTIPGNAALMRVYFETFGGDSTQTDIGEIRRTEVSAGTLFSPDLTAVLAAIAELQSIDAGTRLEALEAAAMGTSILRFPTRTAFAAAAAADSIPGEIEVVETLGRSVPGDGLGAEYVAQDDEPDDDDKVEDDENARWWRAVRSTGVVSDDSPILLPAPASFGVRNFRDFGAIEGDDDAHIAANNAALAAMAALGRPVMMAPGSLFKFGAGVATWANGSGLHGRGSTRWELLMATAAGHFDKADFTGSIADVHRAFIHATGADDLSFDNGRIRLEDPGSAIRTAYAMRLANCGRFHLDMEIRNFREQNGGYIRIDSARGGYWNIHGYDCNPNSITLPSFQGSVVEIDNNRVAAIYSAGLRWGTTAGYNILPAKAMRDHYHGAQTDVLNIQSDQHDGRDNDFVGDSVIAEDVGEPVDNWASGIHIRLVKAKNVYDSGAVKSIYGASRNMYDVVDVDGTGLGVVVVTPADQTSSRPNNCIDNTIGLLKARNVGSLWSTEWQPRGSSYPAAVFLQSRDGTGPGNSGTNKITRTRILQMDIEGYMSGATPIMGYGIVGDTIGVGNYAKGSIRNAGISDVPATGNPIEFHDDDQPGVAFPTTPVLSSDARTLDDYVESDTARALAFGTTAPTGLTYSTNVAKSDKVGRRTQIDATLVLSSKGTGGVGIVSVTLPSAPTTFGVVTVEAANITYPGTYSRVKGLFLPGQSAIALYLAGPGLSDTNLVWSQLTDTTNLIISGSYV